MFIFGAELQQEQQFRLETKKHEPAFFYVEYVASPPGGHDSDTTAAVGEIRKKEGDDKQGSKMPG